MWEFCVWVRRCILYTSSEVKDWERGEIRGENVNGSIEEWGRTRMRALCGRSS